MPAARILDLSKLSPSQGFTIQGDAAGDYAGSSASSAGDINGDGFDDLIVGALKNDAGGKNAGAAYVIFGRTGGTRADIDLSALSASDGFILQGAAKDFAGRSVSSSGDVNGDGFDDLIVGAREDDASWAIAGEAYVIFGRAGGTRANIDLSALSASDGFILQRTSSDGVGSSVSAAGDVNGDGFDDLIVGAPVNDAGGSGAGAAYVIFGRAGGTRADINLATFSSSDGFFIQGAAGGWAGGSVSSAGDVNGDGIDDLIVGAELTGSGGLYDGAAYVIFGRAGGTRADIDLSALSASNGFFIQGAADEGAGGSVSSAGDVNADGIDDLIVGAPWNDAGGDFSGVAYVIFGRAGGTRADIDLSALSANDGFIIQGASGNGAGSSVSAAGDVNGDGIDDLIVGAPWNDASGSNAGAAYVIYGSKSIGVAPWSFTYADPTDILLFAQFAADAYNGTGDNRVSDVVDAPTGWTAFLSTDDGKTAPVGVIAREGKEATFNTSPGSGELAAMQATAYMDASGRVVIAYRGTDDGFWEELVKTSFMLGAGENAGNARAYLQSAVNFYEAVVASGVDPSQISFAGHSLGGIVAGYMAGITGSQGMIFASGPQSLLFERLDGLVSKGTDMGYVTGGTGHQRHCSHAYRWRGSGRVG